jgi:hypothetical protein
VNRELNSLLPGYQLGAVKSSPPGHRPDEAFQDLRFDQLSMFAMQDFVMLWSFW